MEALAERVEVLSAQFEALQFRAKDPRDSSMDDSNPKRDIDELFTLLEQLKASKQLKTRDAHEIGTLRDVIQGDKVEVVRKRLTQIYVATTRSWRDAAR